MGGYKSIVFSFLFIICQSTFSQFHNEKFSLEGYNKPRSYYFLKQIDGLYDFQNEWKTAVDFDWKITPELSLISNTIINLNTSEESRRFINVRDAFLRFGRGNIDLRVGRQMIDWSSLSGWSPSDMPNTSYYYDFIDTEDEEIGRWSFKGSYYIGSTVFNLTVMPFFRPSELYFVKNRWISVPDALVINNAQVPAIFQGTKKTVVSDEFQFGASVDIPIGPAQLKLFYYHGLNDIPVTRVNPQALTANNEIAYEIERIYHRLQQFSIHNTVISGQWNLWSEFNYTRTRIADEENAIRPHEFYNITAGFDRMFDMSNESSLYVLIQYVYAFNNEGVTYSSSDLDHIFNNALIGKFDFTINYNLDLNLRFASEFKTSGYYFNPELIYRLSPSFRLMLRSDILWGSSSSFFGNYRDNTRLGLTVQHYF
ncbi:MAG: hypothetical protein HKO90_00430 [Flavobacteriaceae bacterium]|nr:hypothetical protein [Flavobacteriaceae bacterium]